MNKSQKLDIMILRAKMKAKEALARHESAWRGQEIKPVKGGEDAVTKSGI